MAHTRRLDKDLEVGNNLFLPVEGFEMIGA